MYQQKHHGKAIHDLRAELWSLVLESSMVIFKMPVYLNTSKSYLQMAEICWVSTRVQTFIGNIALGIVGKIQHVFYVTTNQTLLFAWQLDGTHVARKNEYTQN